MRITYFYICLSCFNGGINSKLLICHGRSTLFSAFVVILTFCILIVYHFKQSKFSILKQNFTYSLHVFQRWIWRQNGFGRALLSYCKAESIIEESYAYRTFPHGDVATFVHKTLTDVSSKYNVHFAQTLQIFCHNKWGAVPVIQLYLTFAATLPLLFGRYRLTIPSLVIHGQLKLLSS